MSTRKQLPLHLDAVLSGHQSAVHAVTFSAGLGQYVLTGSADRSIHLYNPEKSEIGQQSSGLVQKYDAHGYGVLDLAVVSDNSRFTSCGGDKQVLLWDVAAVKTLRRWSGHHGRVNCVSFGGENGDLVISGSFDATVRMWDARGPSAKPIQILQEAGDSVSDVKVSNNEIVTSSVDGKVRYYDLRMGLLTVDLIGHPVTSVQRTLDGHTTLVSSLDSSIRLMHRRDGIVLQSYMGHVNINYRIRCCLGLAESIVFGGSDDGMVYIWDLLTGDKLQSLRAHAGKLVSAIAWNNHSSQWASAGADGLVRIWGNGPS